MPDFMVILFWLPIVLVFLHYGKRVWISSEHLVAPPLVLSFVLIYVFIIGYLEHSEQEIRAFMSHEYYLLTLAYTILSLILFCVGYEHGTRTQFDVDARISYTKKLLSFRRVYSIGVAALGVAGLLVFLQLSGGVRAFYSAAHGSGGAWVTTSAYIHSLPTFLWPAMLMMYWLWERSERTDRAIFFGLLGLVVLLAVHTYLMGNRNGVIRFCLFLGGTYILMKRPKGRQFATLIAVLLIAVAFVKVLPHIRDATHLGSERSVVEALDDYLKKKPERRRTISNRSSGSELFYNVAIVKGVSETGKIGFGAQYIYVVINFVPRFVWPEKPYRANFGVSAKKTAQRATRWRVRNGAAINAVGHSFLEFWWLGSLVWAVLGYGCGRRFRLAQINPTLHNVGYFLALDLSIVYWATQSFTAFFCGWFFVAAPLYGLRLLEQRENRESVSLIPNDAQLSVVR